MKDYAWRKSQRSYPNGNCVEVAETPEGGMKVRDSKAPNGGILTFSREAWRGLVAAIKANEL